MFISYHVAGAGFPVLVTAPGDALQRFRSDRYPLVEL